MYKHTQIGKLLVSVVGVTALVTGLAGILALEYLELAPAIILFSISGILLVCLMLFSTLTITIRNDLVIVKYGIGLVQTFGNQIHYNNIVDNTNYGLEGFLCYDNARLNYWNGHRLPYLNGDIIVGGLLPVHPCLINPILFNN